MLSVRFPRSSGILLHPTSLPGPFGIGDLGKEARRFVDFLADAGQSIWQVLPLGPTGFGDSPYQLFSAFAGNPLLISLEELADNGWLNRADFASPPQFPNDAVEFGRVIPWKTERLREAVSHFRAQATKSDRVEFESFCRREASWLDDFALFSALKDAHGGVDWTRWETDLVERDPEALDQWRTRLAREIEGRKFIQWQFHEQWCALKQYAGSRGIRIMGDLPIYVAHDGADVWAHQDLFLLDDRGHPSVIAGVPPDYFSATGQLWGNPIYDWERLAETGYAWWIDRVKATLTQVDLIRIDHFRGFEAFWEVSADEKTAVNGRWVKAPGKELFQALGAALGQLPVVAENLGVITPEVEALRTHFGFPGMSILQFAFGDDPNACDFLPHNYSRNRVAYTGTHDNDTVMGWWSSTGGDSTRTPEQIALEKERARRYLHTDGREMNKVMIRALMGSVADTVLFPLQDVLGLGSEARMNTPAVLGGNWRWRFRREVLTEDIAAELREMVEVYQRSV
jgi:4-alpha-glucanotransferase